MESEKTNKPLNRLRLIVRLFYKSNLQTISPVPQMQRKIHYDTWRRLCIAKHVHNIHYALINWLMLNVILDCYGVCIEFKEHVLIEFLQICIEQRNDTKFTSLNFANQTTEFALISLLCCSSCCIGRRRLWFTVIPCVSCICVGFQAKTF